MRKRTFLLTACVGSSSIFGATLGTGMSSAQAASSLVPNHEGEILVKDKNGNVISCAVSSNSCFDRSQLGYSVTSLAYDTDKVNPQFGLSRLFVDNINTPNNWGNGIKFNGGQTRDAGTNPLSFWLRPVAYTAKTENSAPDAKGSKVFENGGQLEVGRYLLEFDRKVKELDLEFFDIEDSGITGILEVNGQKYNNGLLPAGPDSNIQTKTVKDVRSIVIQLGNQGPKSMFSKTGDGVRLRGFATYYSAARTPEPGTLLSLGALGLTAMFGVQRRKKAAKAS